MTLKHFRVLANALSFAKPSPTDLPRYEQWLLDIDFIACACAECNPRFDRAQFIETCKQQQ